MLTVDFTKLELKPGFKVLDAGCGEGRHLGESFRRHGVHVVGIDRDHENVVTSRNTLRIMEKEGEGGGRFLGNHEGRCDPAALCGSYL